MIHDDILDEANSIMLDLLVALIQVDSPRTNILVPGAFDWFAVYREWESLGRHLLRTADETLAQVKHLD